MERYSALPFERGGEVVDRMRVVNLDLIRLLNQFLKSSIGLSGIHTL
jgi:hypothetical protein